MGLFGKKEKEEKKQVSLNKGNVELPNLPDFAKFDDSNSEDFSMRLPQLPSFPDSTTGNKFSQSTIKQAVTGREEVGDKDFADYDSDEEENSLQKSIEPPKKVFLKKEIPQSFKESSSMVKKTEPLFIRIDKFEESMDTLKKTKEQISDVEKMLSDIKQIKEKETKELEYWEDEIRSVKERIEKINSNLFSRIE